MYVARTCSDSLTRINNSTRLELRFLATRTRLESRREKWWLDSSHVFHRMTRLESESFLQNLWAPDGQTQFVCTQRNEHFLLRWWSRLAQIFCFAFLVDVVLCHILKIKWASQRVSGCNPQLKFVLSLWNGVVILQHDYAANGHNDEFAAVVEEWT